MSGYREHRFDPLAATNNHRSGVRPYDHWQWLGLAICIAVAPFVLLDLAQTFAKAFGGEFLPNYRISHSGFTLALLGGSLVGFRDPQQQAGKLDSLRTVALLLAILGLVVILLNLFTQGA